MSKMKRQPGICGCSKIQKKCRNNCWIRPKFELFLQLQCTMIQCQNHV